MNVREANAKLVEMGLEKSIIDLIYTDIAIQNALGAIGYKYKNNFGQSKNDLISTFQKLNDLDELQIKVQYLDKTNQLIKLDFLKYLSRDIMAIFEVLCIASNLIDKIYKKQIPLREILLPNYPDQEPMPLLFGRGNEVEKKITSWLLNDGVREYLDTTITSKLYHVQHLRACAEGIAEKSIIDLIYTDIAIQNEQ